MDTAANVLTLASGLRLSYAAHGPLSGDAVVFVPGPTDSCVSYEPVLAMLPDDLRAVALSPRGHGDSDKPPSGYAIDDFAHDVVDALDALEVGRAVVAGHSGSCFVARRVAVTAPHRVAGLVLEAAPDTLRGNAGLEEFVDSTISTLSDPIDADFARRWITDTSSDAVDGPFVDRLVDEVLKVPARAWREMFASLIAYDDRHDLSTLTAPVLLVWGDADAILTRTMQDALLAQLPDAELAVYACVGHAPRWEEPTRFARDVAAFAHHCFR